jgi:hypothetical protein
VGAGPRKPELRIGADGGHRPGSRVRIAWVLAVSELDADPRIDGYELHLVGCITCQTRLHRGDFGRECTDVVHNVT